MASLFDRWRRLLQKPTNSTYPLKSAPGRVRLQPFQADEITLVEEWFQDQDTCQMAFGVKAPWTVLSTIRSEYLEELQKDKVGVLSVKVESAEALWSTVGFVRYHITRRGGKRQARVGIILGDPACRGKGLGQEAFSTLIDYLFEERSISVVELDTAVFNHKAKACFEDCGFKPIREMEFTSIQGNWTERRLVMRQTRNDWLSNRA